MAIVGNIPARYGSKRLPGKPLSDIHGKPLIERLHACARAARSQDRVMVARDDERIAIAVRSRGETVRPSPGAEEDVVPPSWVLEGERGSDEDTPEDLERVRALRAPGKGTVA